MQPGSKDMAEGRAATARAVSESDRVRATYQKRARHYDKQAALYHLMGFRDHFYRRRAVDALRLQPGDTVVELGVGTGRNLSALAAAVGAKGRVIGIDLSPAMLEQAAARAAAAGWSNVELVEADVARVALPDGIQGVLATFALNLGPEHAGVVDRVAAALAPGGRLVVLDLRRPRFWPTPLLRVMLLAVRPFCVTLASISRDVPAAMRRHLRVSERRFYFGFVYLAVGHARSATTKAKSGMATSEAP